MRMLEFEEGGSPLKMITETKLESWVLSKGVRPVSKELQVTQATIYRWLRGG